MATKWLETKQTKIQVISQALINLSKNFIYLGKELDFGVLWMIILVLSTALFLYVIIYFIFLIRDKKVTPFILLMIGLIPFTLLLTDLILGGQRSFPNRYLIGNYLGIDLALAYIIATAINSHKTLQRLLGKILIVSLICCGLLSGTINSQIECSGNKPFNCTNLQIAKTINQASRPLVITENSDSNSIQLLSISYKLASKVRVKFVAEIDNTINLEDFSEVFIYTPSKKLQEQLEKSPKYHLVPVVQGKLINLWKLNLTKTISNRF